jgi:hypothetical protein
MKKNFCQHSVRVTDYLLGLLEHDEQKEFEAHLVQCSTCQKELKIEKAIMHEFSSQLEAGRIEHIVLMKLRLRKEFKPGFSWRYIFKTAAYACAAAVLGVLFLPLFMKFVLGVSNNFAGISISPWWIESIASITSLFAHTYIFLGAGISLALACMIYSIHLLRQQLV